MNKALLRHDKLVDLTIDDMIENHGWKIHELHALQPYTNNGMDGEIDLYAVRGKYIFLFEMKCSLTQKTYTKAQNQTSRAIHYFFESHINKLRIFPIMVHYDLNNKKGFTYRKL